MDIPNLIFDSVDKNKEVLKKYTELWDGMKNETDIINDGECKYGKDFTKIEFDTDYDLLLNLHILTIIVRSVFEDEGKFYPQNYLDGCLVEYDRIDISEGIDVNKTNA